MEIKTIEKAKEFIGKNIYNVNGDDKKPRKLFIGGVFLFYNQVNYEITGFATYEDEKCNEYWGEVKLESIKEDFDENVTYYTYCFTEKLANQYQKHLIYTTKNSRKIQAIKTAKQVLDEEKIKYTIFD